MANIDQGLGRSMAISGTQVLAVPGDSGPLRGGRGSSTERLGSFLNCIKRGCRGSLEGILKRGRGVIGGVLGGISSRGGPFRGRSGSVRGRRDLPTSYDEMIRRLKKVKSGEAEAPPNPPPSKGCRIFLFLFFSLLFSFFFSLFFSL